MKQRIFNRNPTWQLLKVIVTRVLNLQISELWHKCWRSPHN